MKRMSKCAALLLTLALVVGLLSSLTFTASAATVNYVYSGSYVYNWGTRGTVATFLSPMAEDWYEKYDADYDNLASLSGSPNSSSVPSSALYKELQSLMKGAHKYITSYKSTTSMYKCTDCEANGSRISSFYSGKLIGPSWDSGSTWNREHTWPNSKGSGDAENDIMMLRPTSVSENSSRGNTAYGKSSGYYNPNSEAGGKYDLRGDVARICLYVYCRWGNTSNMWGSGGVMESKDVLIEWMEADPVDTWELGRNDSVQSITGTRNVFVDYPELAFIMFGEDIPNGYASPSGEGKGGSATTTTTTTTTRPQEEQPDLNITTTTTKGQGGVTATTKGQSGNATGGQQGTTTTTEQLSQEQAGNTTATSGFRPGMAMNGKTTTTAATTTAASADADPQPQNMTWIIIAGAAAVLLIGAGIILLVTRKKK